MTDTPIFFDYDSDEYKALRDPYEQQKAVHESITERRNKAKAQLEQLDLEHRVSLRQLDNAWKPINEWYHEQSRLRDNWMREQLDKEPGNE